MYNDCTRNLSTPISSAHSLHEVISLEFSFVSIYCISIQGFTAFNSLFILHIFSIFFLTVSNFAPFLKDSKVFGEKPSTQTNNSSRPDSLNSLNFISVSNITFVEMKVYKFNSLQ